MPRADLFNPDLFDLIIGTTMAPSAISALGTNEALWVSRFNTWIETHWTNNTYNGLPTQTGPDPWAFVNQYDRAFIYYTWYKMGGYASATYLSRAEQILEYYRDTYFAPGGLGTVQAPPHHAHMKGMACHYAATGDTLSRDLLQERALGWAWVYSPTRMPDLYTATDGRDIARVLESFILCELLGVPGGTFVDYTVTDWATEAASMLTRILDAQHSGMWFWSVDARIYPYDSITDCCYMDRYAGAVKPPMIGVLCDVLEFYYRTINADSRIPPAIEAACNYMWTQNGNGSSTIWVPEHNSFKYLSRANNETDNNEYNGGEPDNSGLIFTGYAFTYQRTGNQLWKDRVALILQGTMPGGGWSGAGAGISGSKQFNEAYQATYKVWPMLQAAVNRKRTKLKTR